MSPTWKVDMVSQEQTQKSTLGFLSNLKKYGKPKTILGIFTDASLSSVSRGINSDLAKHPTLNLWLPEESASSVGPSR